MADDDGGVSADVLNVNIVEVTIANVAPTATFNAPASVDEGSDISLSLTDVVDPSDTDTHEFNFSCDGADWSGWSSSSTHVCPTNDDGSRTVKGQVRDSDLALSPVYEDTVTIENVAPTATFNNNGPVNEGSDINLSLTAPSDPSSVDTAAGFEYRFSCDNGTTWSDWDTSNSFSCSTNDNGPRDVKGQIRDKDLDASTYSAVVTVSNVAPTATFNNNGPVNEGSDINLSLTAPSDPSSVDTAAGFEYRFSCDNGTTWSDWDTSNSFSCSTNDNGPRDVKGQIRDKDLDASTYSAVVTVSNVAPTATFNHNGPVNEGSDINLSLTDVVDPGSADTFEYRFSCDGGTTWTAWSSTSTHACSTNDNGTRSVKGQVRDDDGGESAEYSASVTVNNVAPTATFGNNGPVNEGSNIMLSLTDPSDPSSVDTAAGFEYRFSCDNGSTWTAWTSSNTHACSTNDNGTRNVRGEIRDKDGGVSTYSAAVTINNVAPTVTINGAPATSPEGTPISVTGTFTDPGSADTHTRAWSVTKNGNPYATGTGPSFSFTPNDNGTYVVTYTVTDDDGGVGTDSETITVTNVAPTLTHVGAELVPGAEGIHGVGDRHVHRPRIGRHVHLRCGLGRSGRHAAEQCRRRYELLSDARLHRSGDLHDLDEGGRRRRR